MAKKKSKTMELYLKKYAVGTGASGISNNARGGTSGNSTASGIAAGDKQMEEQALANLQTLATSMFANGTSTEGVGGDSAVGFQSAPFQILAQQSMDQIGNMIKSFQPEGELFRDVSTVDTPVLANGGTVKKYGGGGTVKEDDLGQWRDAHLIASRWKKNWTDEQKKEFLNRHKDNPYVSSLVNSPQMGNVGTNEATRIYQEQMKSKGPGNLSLEPLKFAGQQVASTGKDWINQLFGTTYANGTGVNGIPNVPVEVEGEEIIETPNGNVSQMKGAKHENGGIQGLLPEGTKVYSDRIEVDGKSMQQRKKTRINKENKVDKRLKRNPSDPITRNTKRRLEITNAIEEELDLALQSVVNKRQALETANNQMLANGTGPDGLNPPFVSSNPNVQSNPFGYLDILPNLPMVDNPNRVATGDTLGANNIPIDPKTTPYTIDQYKTRPIIADDNVSNITPVGNPEQIISTTPQADPLAGIQKVSTPGVGGIEEPVVNENETTEGDKLGYASNIAGSLLPSLTTIGNRITDTPNVNAYKGFGKDALAANRAGERVIAGNQARGNRDIQLQENAARLRNSRSARSLNTIRALDQATDIASLKAREGLMTSAGNQRLGLLAQRAQLENAQDAAVMAGEQQRDLADRQDKDNFATNMAQNFANMSEFGQSTAKALNQKEYNKKVLELTERLRISTQDATQILTEQGYTNTGK